MQISYTYKKHTGQKKMVDRIKKEWEGLIILNPGTQDSKGTTALFH